MTEHLATSERVAPQPCEFCLRALAYPPNPFCALCLEYMRDCEAEVSEGR